MASAQVLSWSPACTGANTVQTQSQRRTRVRVDMRFQPCSEMSGRLCAYGRRRALELTRIPAEVIMTIYGMLTFCAVYALAVAAPGPGVAAVIARGLAHGLKGTPAFIAGFMVGDLVWFAIA